MILRRFASFIGRGRVRRKVDEDKITGEGPSGKFDLGAKETRSTREDSFVFDERRKRNV
jgi:hypothetical protein